MTPIPQDKRHRRGRRDRYYQMKVLPVRPKEKWPDEPRAPGCAVILLLREFQHRLLVRVSGRFFSDQNCPIRKDELHPIVLTLPRHTIHFPERTKEEEAN